jgi:cation:H+ antiporter
MGDSNNLVMMLLWLAELTFSSWLLSYGAEHLSFRYGAKFVGRTLLSVATTLPEIVIVLYAAASGSYGVAIASGLGSNLLMMTLGLALMLLIATTKLSKKPLKSIDVTAFKLDKIFLLITAVVSAVIFLDGYNYIDGVIFLSMFIAYIVMAFVEMAKEKSHRELEKPYTTKSEKTSGSIESKVNPLSRRPIKIRRQMVVAIIVFLAGTIGIALGAEPFIHSLEGFSADVGISAVILAVIISPIAGEMPEKISLMLLARKGGHGASIAIANVLGSKILNNTLLLAVAVYGAMLHGGFYSSIYPTPLLLFQISLVTIVTLIALGLMSKRNVGLRTGIILASLYVGSIGIQFVFGR